MNIKTIVVLGMHRSGTSMVAGLLESLGCSMGTRMFCDLRSNPMGHYENMDFMNLNIEILEKAGGDWIYPPAENEILKLGSMFASRISELITANNIDHSLWGWKDPRNSLTASLFVPHLRNPHYVYCTRNEVPVAESLRQRNGFSIDKGIALKMEYDARVRVFLAKVDAEKVFNASYEKIQANPESFVMDLAGFLQVKVADAALDKTVAMILPRDRLNALKARVQRKLRRKSFICAVFHKPWQLPFYLLKKYVFKPRER